MSRPVIFEVIFGVIFIHDTLHLYDLKSHGVTVSFLKYQTAFKKQKSPNICNIFPHFVKACENVTSATEKLLNFMPFNAGASLEVRVK